MLSRWLSTKKNKDSDLSGVSNPGIVDLENLSHLPHSEQVASPKPDPNSRVDSPIIPDLSSSADSPIPGVSSRVSSPVPGPSSRVSLNSGLSSVASEQKIPVRRRKVLYKQKYREEWSLDKKYASWCKATRDGLSALCTVCDKKIMGGITHIQRHINTSLHRNNLNKAKNTPKVEELFKNDEKSSHFIQIKEAELKCVMFLHEHNLPFLLMEHLPKFVKSVCPDSHIAADLQISRTKATLITKQCLALEALKNISQKINSSVAYSLIMDETTDVATHKSLVLVIRFYDEKVTDHFFGLLAIKEGTSREIYNATTNYLRDNDIPLRKLVGFAADNAAVMMGDIKGVQALFKNDVPSLYVMGRICHTFHLCSSAAASKLPNTLEDFARGIYNFFSNSSKRLKFLNECQSFLEEKPHKMLHPSQTRWLSLQEVVNRILEHCNSLLIVFQDAVLAENLYSFQAILNNLQDPIYKVYFLFLSYVLDIVNKLNIEFQSEKCKIYLLSDRVSTLYKTVLRNYLKKLYIVQTSLEKIDVINPRNFLPIEEVYYGARVQVILDSGQINNIEMHNFRIRCLDFYTELCLQIKKMFRFNDPVLHYCKLFNPITAVNGSVNSIAANSVQFFPQLVTDIEKLDFEWRFLADCNEVEHMKELEFEEFCGRIFKMKNSMDDLMFPNLSNLVKGIMCLPHSSATAERQFSQYNLIKTKVRNRLNVDTCDSILHAKDLLKGDSCYTWKPSKSPLKRKAQ